MSNLRIAMISEHASPLASLGGIDAGGQNVYVAHTALELARMGHQVDIFTRRDDETLDAVVCWQHGIRVIHVPAGPATTVRKEELLPHMDAFLAFMESFIANEGPYDLVHANFWMSGLVAAGLKQRLGLPFVITFHALGKVRRIHQGEDDGFPRERTAIEQRIVAEADRIVAECPQDRDDLLDLYNADPSRISVVPCGVDPAAFSPLPREEARHRLGVPLDAKLITHVGRMVPRKGVDTPIHALARLRHQYGIDARLLIVGGDSEDPDPRVTPEIGRLQDIARQCGVEDAVSFCGARPRDELRVYYSAADVFVTTPWYEPFGITPLEAMACGTPVIGSCVGGIGHTVSDRETGYLVPPRDPDALAVRLACILNNHALGAELGARGRERVLDSYTWEQVAGQLVDVYATVIAQRRDECVRAAGDRAAVALGFDGAIEALERSRDELAGSLVDAGRLLADTFTRGGKVLVCGNGGSAADGQHFAGELVGRYKQHGRTGLPVVALTADSAILTAWANDVGYDDVFARQVEAYGAPGDILIGISTSGESENIIAAFEAARAHGMQCIALAGRGGGRLEQLADLALTVPSEDTQHTQETHAVIIHLLCELVERHVSSMDTGSADAEAHLNGTTPNGAHATLQAVAG